MLRYPLTVWPHCTNALIHSTELFNAYTLGQKPKQLEPGKFQYAAKQLTTEGDIPHMMVTLEGASGKLNPLRAVRNCELIVRNEQIVGINVDGDCVVMKGLDNEK